jgi:hypothetical protein
MTDPALAESIAPVPADWAWVNNPQSQWDGPT